ncbi:MAG: apolipoprotein N-acyltransferase, partial [Elusimicrobia bacterium]|nr:apolipoprotein N-acyltransferase [Elusimicrobiota bacterium]
WISLEYIRNYYLGSFPINILGYSQCSFVQIIQIADAFGVYGISFVIILVNLLLFYWLYNGEKKYLLSALLIFLFLFIYGYIRINQISKINNEIEIKIGVVQPNIEQKYKFKKKYIKSILYKLKQIGTKFENKNLDLILYPETVLPKHMDKNKHVKEFINKISHLTEYTLIGGMDVENYKVYNSIFIVSKDGNIVDRYRKKHLVLFGEYVPFNNFLVRLLEKVNLTGNLNKEIELKVFKLDKYTLGINICSENYYPYLSRELVLKGATLLTTHSNDSWCDGLSYPYQHFIFNIFRAIENRKFLIVASNTGISGVIAPTGKVIKQTKNQEQICFEETVYTNNYITIYDKIGDIFVFICMIYVLIILLYFLLLKKELF